MKVNGIMIKDMEEDMKDIQMEIFTWVNFNLARHMVKVNMNGRILMKYMMENGRKD